MVTIVSNSPTWKPPWTHSTRLVWNKYLEYIWNKTEQSEIRPLWPLCNLIFYLLGSKASPPLEPPPGVLHASRSMYSSATKGSWPQKKNLLQCATAGCSFSRCSHLIWKVFRSFTKIKSAVLAITPSPLGLTYLLLRTQLLIWWVGTSSLDIITLLANNVLQVCEELALNDIICSWVCGLSFQSAWALQLIWEVTPSWAKHQQNTSENSSAYKNYVAK